MFNYRDLGGHVVPGGQVRTGLLYRSSAVVDLDPDAAAALGLRTAIDLRERGEKDAEPATAGDARVHEVEVIAGDRTAPYTVAEFTHWLVETRGNALADSVRLLAHEPWPAVFFCSSGKDRTGVLSGLLLSALGVADDLVIADYAETEARLPEGYFAVALARSRRAGLAEDSKLEGLASPPELMAALLADVRQRHGDAARYLTDHGLSADDLDLLRQRLVA